ncbi:MAG: heme NO-binding domain-containing protein [Magnetococcus sp. YQC-3]
MHGIIFLALEDFLESHGGAGSWSNAMREANLVEQIFSPDHFYPDEGADDLFTASAKLLNLSRSQTLEKLGRHMSPGLLDMGHSMGLVQKEWRTLDILEHLSTHILAAFSNPAAGMTPPDIRTYRLKHAEVSVAYVSDRKLCALFKGIVQGMGECFNEPIRIEERVCMLENAHLCRMAIFLDDPELKNYVDIKREFQTVHSRIQEIRFFNQFAGVPVVNQGLVLQYGKESVLVQIHPESLLAMRDEQITYLSLPHLHLGLKASVETVDFNQGTVTLRQIVATDGPIGRRVTARVHPTKPLPMECRVNMQTVRGWVDNLSEGGLCMLLPTSPLLDQTMIFTPIKLRFTLPLKASEESAETPPKILLDGNILNIDEKEGRQIVRIVFQPLSVKDAALVQKFNQEREQQSFQQLRTLLAAVQK